MATRLLLSALTTLAVATAAMPGHSSAEPNDDIPGRYVVVLKGSVDRPGTVAAEHEDAYEAEPAAIYRHALNGYVADIPRPELAELRSDPAVQFVARDRVVARLPKQNGVADCEDLDLDREQCLPDGLNRIDGDRSSARSGDGRGRESTNIAILDSGVDTDHPDLNVVGGANCASGSPDPDPAGYDDQYGHGTAVAGVAAAKDNRFGAVGVAPGAPIWALKVEDAEGFISYSMLICAVDWVTATRTDRDRHNDIAVANMSIYDPEVGPDDDCGRTNRDALHLAFCRSVQAGTTHVVSAGNDDVDLTGTIPAGYDEVLAATAMADFDGRPGGRAAPECYGEDYGQFGEYDDQVVPWTHYATTAADKRHVLAAPGSCIDTTVPLDWGYRYAAWSGTSFSSPYIAGAAALCIARGRCAGGPKQVMRKLVNDAQAYNLAHPNFGFIGDPLRPLGPEYYGYLINAGIY